MPYSTSDSLIIRKVTIIEVTLTLAVERRQRQRCIPWLIMDLGSRSPGWVILYPYRGKPPYARLYRRRDFDLEFYS